MENWHRNAVNLLQQTYNSNLFNISTNWNGLLGCDSPSKTDSDKEINMLRIVHDLRLTLCALCLIRIVLPVASGLFRHNVILSTPA